MTDVLQAQKPLIERIGTDRINIAVLCIYTGLWFWGFVTWLLIPIHAAESWPLALAFAFVLSAGIVRALETSIGSFLLPNYVFYPISPMWLFALGDAVMFQCVVAILVSYSVDAHSSSVPIFACFFLLTSLGILVYKLIYIVVPVNFTTIFTDTVGDKTEQELEPVSLAAPGARKLVALLNNQKLKKLQEMRANRTKRGVSRP